MDSFVCHQDDTDKIEELNLKPLLIASGEAGHRSQESLNTRSLFELVEKEGPVSQIQCNTSETQQELSEHKALTNVCNIIVCKKSERRARRLNTLLLEAVRNKNDSEVERLLNMGAHPEATCNLELISACHLAALAGGNALSLLLKYGAQKNRIDRLGRTPLHLAAWAGNVREVAVLLDFSENLASKVESTISKEAEIEIRSQLPKRNVLANVHCKVSNANGVPKEWRDNIDHECKVIGQSLPLLYPGWTPLHAASSRGQSHCVKLLILAGADHTRRDVIGRTPLDVVGNYFYYGQEINPQQFTEVIKQLLDLYDNVCSYVPRTNYDTPLHTAVELENLDAVNILLEAGVPLKRFNRMGLTPLHLCVKRKLKEHLQALSNHLNNENNLSVFNLRDKDGNTVLHSAVISRWIPGVCIALEAGADILEKTNDGETAIHLAAAIGDSEMLSGLLSIVKQKHLIDYPNEYRETALFKAVMNGHTNCVKKLLEEGASVKWILPKHVNIFHIAAEFGHKNILKILLDHNYKITRELVNFTDNRKGYGPIHLAVLNNHAECVKLLLSNNAYVSLRTTLGIHFHVTPLHIAAEQNFLDIAKILVKFDKSTVKNLDNMSWSPLHSACHHRSREVIKFLIREGADLSAMTNGPNKLKKTALDIIINNLTKPTEFMEEVFDLHIYCNKFKLQDPSCEVTVDYNILLPNGEKVKQIKVVESLLDTGNRYNQRRLLLHPLLESFLYLKWKALLPFFYTILALYGLFVIALTTFIVSTFFYKDTLKITPKWLDVTTWKCVVHITIFFIVFQEILYMNITRRYFLQLDTWVKFASVTLALVVPYAIETSPEMDWPRHVATMALLFSWLELMFLLSRLPNCGYYVLMFRKVSSNVIKILLTFAFLVIGFALSFMVQFHSKIPFESPWAALVKTMVMMTSEFDYDDLMEKDLTTSLIVIRITFLTFLILAAIVLMNLMVGVAVNDLHNLEVLGNIRRLEKQVEFLGSLETLVFKSFLDRIMPKKLKLKFENCTKVSNLMVLRPNNPSLSFYKILPLHIRDGLFDKIQSKKLHKDGENGVMEIRNKLNEIHKATIKLCQTQSPPRHNGANEANDAKNDDEKMKRVSHAPDIDVVVRSLKNELKAHILDTRTSLEVINTKIDMILNKLQVKT